MNHDFFVPGTTILRLDLGYKEPGWYFDGARVVPFRYPDRAIQAQNSIAEWRNSDSEYIL